MRKPLDQSLFRLMDALPDWSAVLSPQEADLLQRRRQGATLKELAAQIGLSPAGVRARLYGMGAGGLRHGGILGKMRGLAMRQRRSQHG